MTFPDDRIYLTGVTVNCLFAYSYETTRMFSQTAYSVLFLIYPHANGGGCKPTEDWSKTAVMCDSFQNV
jgi:hypothetical protein